MSNFKNLCSSSYGKVSSGMSLQNLTVFFRNGDRSPEDGKNLAWQKRMCINCDGSKCSLSHCRNGMLTVKGYKQGHDLSAFIKQEYYSKFNDKKIEIINNIRANKNLKTGSSSIETLENTSVLPLHDNVHGAMFSSTIKHSLEDLSPDIRINGYYYSNNRSYAFLKSVVESLEYSDLELQKIRSLNVKKSCIDLKNSIFQKTDSDRITPGGEFDRILTSLCTDVPIDCEKFDCDLMKMEDYLVHTMQSFEDDISKMREEFLSVAVDFAPLSKFVLEKISGKADINLVSVTSETILTLLAGLNTNNQELVQYSGAVFLELWKDKAGTEFYGLRYNNKQMEFGLYKEKYVKKSEFMKFLDMFASNDRKIEKICRFKVYSTKKADMIAHKKKELLKLLDPLIEKLHAKRLLIK